MAAGGASQLGWEVRLAVLLVSPRPLWTQRTWGLCRSPPRSLHPQAEHPLLPLLSAGKDPPAGQQREPGWCPGSCRSPPERERRSAHPAPAGALQAPGLCFRIATEWSWRIHQRETPISPEPGILHSEDEKLSPSLACNALF